MAAKTSRCLVVDTSVVCAAGNELATHPTSKRCRDFLLSLLEVCHRVVMTSDIGAEWDKYYDFTRKWWKAIVSRKKLVLTYPTRDESLLRKLQKSSLKKRDLREMLDDWLLIEAALATDRSIASLEDSVRTLFAGVSESLAPLKQIVWVNPDREDETPILWLEEGAKPDRKRMLGWQA